jgi:hypothetical protein
MAVEKPRRQSGKWGRPGVPQRGWRCLFITDLEEPAHTCQMCEAKEVLYVHSMQHDDYPEILDVGCECAARMEPSRRNAPARVREMKNRTKRRANWLTRRWRVSVKGNPWLKTHGHHITIFRKGRYWTFSIGREDDDSKYFADPTFATSEEAKLAAFDYVWRPRTQIDYRALSTG